MRRKLAALLLCLLLVFQLSPVPSGAAETVYFTAVNKNVLTLSDDTMPFWSGGYLYVPSTIFTGVGRDLGVSYYPNIARQTVLLYVDKTVYSSLVFDLNKEYAIDNEVWQEWCEAVSACQTDRSLKSTLTPIVSKLSDMRVVNGELENLVFGPRKEFVTMAILVLINIPLVRFINTDWYHTLVDTIPGQMVIAVCIAAVFVSFAFVVKLTQPIEYRR